MLDLRNDSDEIHQNSLPKLNKQTERKSTGEENWNLQNFIVGIYLATSICWTTWQYCINKNSRIITNSVRYAEPKTIRSRILKLYACKFKSTHYNS